MHEESISQAEIDALVKGLAGPAETPAAPAAAPDDTALLKEIFREFTSLAGKALSELVGAPCQGRLAELTSTNVVGVGGLISGQLLVGRSNLTGGLNGPFYYLMPLSLGLAMITQIYGGVAPSALDDSALGALADGLMQMNQSGINHLADGVLGKAILPGVIAVNQVHSLGEAGGLGPGNPVYALAIDLTAGDDAGRVYLVIPHEVTSPLLHAARANAGRRPQTSQAALAESMTPVFAAPQAQSPPSAATLQAAAASAAAPIAYPPARFPDIAPVRSIVREEIRNIDLLMDVNLQVTVELGRTRRQIRDVLSLGPGSVLELDKLAGEQVDVLVNGKLIAKGEVVVIDENYGVRITDIISPVERVQSLK
jgi:flagellar motor switch protein FliN